MAGAIGKAGGSYATVNRSNNYFGGAMQNAQDNAFRFRQERKVKEDEAKAEKEKIDNEINAGLGKISSDTTRFPTQNALIIDATHKLRNAVAEKANLYKNGKISKLDYDTFYANAKSQVDVIDQSAKMINTQYSDALTQIKDGKVNPAFAEYMANAGYAYENNNISLKLKEDLTFESVLYDDNDNIIEVSDLSKFGVKTFTPITDYDLDKDLSEFVKTYPKVLNEEIKNNLKIGTKGTAPEIEKAIEEKVNSTLKDRNQMAIVNYKRSGKVVPDVTNPDDIKANKEYLTNLYNGLYSEEKSVDEALGGARLAEQVRANKEKEKQDRVEEAGRNTRANKANAIKVNTDKNKKPTLKESVIGGVRVIKNTKESGIIPNNVSNGASVFSVKNMQTIGAEGKVSSIIDKVYKNADGTMVFEGRQFDEKGVSTLVVYENPQDQMVFVNSINKKIKDDGSGENYTHLNEFSDDLETITKSKKVAPKSKKTVTKKTTTTKPKSGVGSKYN